MGIKWGDFMKTLLGLVVCLLSLTARADLKYPNADSLSYWNRAVEMRDLLVVLRKNLADTEGYLISQRYYLAKKIKLHAANALTEHELRENQWLADDLVLKISEIKEEMAETELFEKLFMLRYQLAKEEKTETVAELAATYTEQWRRRANLHEIKLARARAELAFKQWVFETVSKLHVKKAQTEDAMIQARDLRDEALGRAHMAEERMNLAKQAEKESMQTEGLVR